MRCDQKAICGAVDAGPALLVENLSAAHDSVGIEVHVGQEDAEVRNFAISATAEQQGGIGVIGRGDYGVVGQSPDNVGVMGFGTTGVFGFLNDPDGCGVERHMASPSGIGVRASAPAPEITALAIDTGNIRVLGAGQNTSTPVFIHLASEENTRGNHTIIDHPMTNGDPNAILIITRRMSPSGDSAARTDEGAASSVESNGESYGRSTHSGCLTASLGIRSHRHRKASRNLPRRRRVGVPAIPGALCRKSELHGMAEDLSEFGGVQDQTDSGSGKFLGHRELYPL